MTKQLLVTSAKVKGYNPEQPRAPKGSETGGQWVADGAGEGEAEQLSNGPVFISQDDARAYYEAGLRYRKAGQSLEDAIWDYFEGRGDWSSFAAFQLGYNERPFEIVKWQRYRDIAQNAMGTVQPSYNRMEGTLERGVSAIYPGWESTVQGMFYVANAEERGYKKIAFYGIDTGYRGGDGEPLVIPIDVRP